MESKPIPDGWDARALAYLSGQMDDRPDEREAFEKQVAASDEGRDALSRARAVLDAAHAQSDAAIDRMARATIAQALDKNATDLHLIAERRNVMVRVRVGGAWHELMTLPQTVHQSLVDWWKTKINTDTTERRKPQNGQMVLRHNKQEFGLRVVILPQFWGESVYVRFQNRSQNRLGLNTLGLRPEQIQALQDMIATPNGLVLTSGPKHAGKTTLLYSLLHEIQRSEPARSIVTAEEPVEWARPGMGQTTVNPDAGLTRAHILKAFLQAEPDVIYCSELREAETARLAIEAALTGSLVLSVVPGARSAWESAERMGQMGVPRFELSMTLIGLIGQRLVRVFTPDTPTEPDKPQSRDFASLGLSPEEDGPFFRPANAGGWASDRAGLFEIVPMTSALASSLVHGATSDELWELSCGASGTSLRDEAARLVRQQRTTVEEAVRAIADYPHAFPSAANLPTAETLFLPPL